MHKKYIVRLTETERGVLEALVNSGKRAARALTHARILLKADCGPDGPAWTDLAISTALDVRIPTIERVGARWCWRASTLSSSASARHRARANSTAARTPG